MRRPRSTASRSAPSLPRTIRTSSCWTANSRRNPSTRCSSSRKPVSRWYDGRGQDARARGRRPVAAGSGRVGGLSPRRRAAFQAGPDPHAFRPCRRRLRRPRPYDLPALRRAWRRCSFPIGRCGSRTIATSSSSRGSSATRSGCARASASIGPRGRIRAFAADHVLDGGGLANFSASVADVGATGAIGIYDIPKVDVTTVAVHSRGVPAGSMRGYGTLQTMTALEVLIDEAAARAAASTRSSSAAATRCRPAGRP